MPDSEAKVRWMKENLYTIGFKLHRKHDADIIALLEPMGAEKQKFLKTVIREYMRKESNGSN